MELDRMVVLAIGLVAASVPGAVTTQTAPAVAATPALSGSWRINIEKSEDAGEKLRAAMAARHRGGTGEGGGRPGGGYGGHGAHGGYGGHGGDRSGGGAHRQGGSRDSVRDLVDTPSEMTITQTDSEIALAERDGRLRLLHPGGEPFTDADGGQVRTRWENQHLVVDTKHEQGAEVSETYTLGADPRQLVIDVRVESRYLGVVTVRRVYDPDVTD